MAMLTASASAVARSPFCRPEEDPFLLLESTLLEEEVIPAMQQCLKRVDELDERLLAQQ